jgi:mannitol operon transcriptional antiterminator
MQSLSREPLLVFLTPQLLRFSIRILKETEARLNIYYTDSGQIALIVRIALSIYRIRSGHSLTELNMDMDGLRGLSELPTAKLIAFEIEKQFDLEVNAKEKIYLAMHLSATRILSRGSSFSDPLQALNIRQVVMAMTSVAEQLTGIPFKSDSTLINDLVSHISMTEKQLELNLVSRVTYTEDLKRTYPEIYAAAETACEVLREWVQPRVIHDAEIGLIAMHFAASAERYQNSKQKVSVAVVCPTGIGSSRMLAATLTGAFHNLEVRKVISAFSIDTQALRDNGIDLIISTTDLHIDFPYIVVEKVLKAQDKLLVSQEIDRIGKEKLQRRIQQGGRHAMIMDVDDIRRTSEIGAEIVEILNHFRVARQARAENIRQMMEMAASVFAGPEEDIRRLADCFQEREKLGATYIPDMQICLFHGACDLVEHSRFGFLVLDEPLATTETLIRGAVIMVVPESFRDSYRVEPAGRLSALLVEDERFLQALQRGDEAAGFNLAREALVKYFQHVIRQQ